MSSKQDKAKPPRLGRWLLESFCSYDFLSTALWDLEELFHENVKDKGIHRAKLLYLGEAFSIVTHLFFKGKSQYSTNKTAMFKHNILISIRSFKRFKSTFFINLIGLAGGLASILLIFLWVAQELSMDKFHSNNERLYQIMQNAESPSGIMTFPWTPLKVGETLRDRFPEIEKASTIYLPDEDRGASFLNHTADYFSMREIWVDEHFLEIMNFPIILGNTTSLFDQLDGVMISQSLVEKLFDTDDSALGKTVHLQNSQFDKDFVVVGIFEDVPTNSTLQFQAIFNLETYTNKRNKSFSEWISNNTVSYALLKPEADLEEFNKKVYGLTEEHAPNANSKLFAQRFDQKYLYGIYENGSPVGGRIAFVRLFSIVAIVILIIGCINFMNLSTAKANTRLKELGVKKALGAHRRSLVQQYFTEAFLLTFFATVLGLFLALLILPFFNSVIGQTLEFNLNSTIVLGLLAIILVTSLLAGSYPAFYLSRLKTIASLKGNAVGSFTDTLARKGLVIFQFSISIVLIVSVLIISNQLDYIQTKPLGYNRFNVISFKTNSFDKSSFNSLLNDIDRIPSVLVSTGADHDLNGNSGGTSGVVWPGQEERITFLNLEVGMGFIDAMEIEIVDGRGYDPQLATDYDKIIFNQAAIAHMGLDNPIGQTVRVWGRDRQIIGVVKDFNLESLYEEIKPTMIQVFDESFSNVLVKLQAGSEIKTINQIGQVYDKHSKGVPFEFTFLDSGYQAMYESEKQVATLAQSFAFVAILISCLGLFGLTAFTTERRIKEIGVRKVLGASVWRIVSLLTMDFSKMIIAALVIGLPVSYFIAQHWISNFAFAIELKMMYFILAGLTLLGIAWFTVSFQTFKAARTNPVDSLRSE